MVEALGIPVVINGGINNGQKACAVMKETNCHSVMVAQSLLENHRMLVDVNACAGELAAEYLANCVRWPPPSPLYIRKHLRWIFRKELQPVRTSNPEEYKAQFKSWRPKLWTFLVRPYLTDMIQFQQVLQLLPATVHQPVLQRHRLVHRLLNQRVVRRSHRQRVRMQYTTRRNKRMEHTPTTLELTPTRSVQ